MQGNAAKRLLRCWPTLLYLSMSLIWWPCVAASIGFRRGRRESRRSLLLEVSLKDQILPVVSRIARSTTRRCIYSGLRWILFSCCSRRHHNLSHLTCGRQAARTWTRSIAVFGVGCKKEYRKLQWVTVDQVAAPHWDVIEHSTSADCRRRSHWRLKSTTTSFCEEGKGASVRAPAVKPVTNWFFFRGHLTLPHSQSP